MISVEKVTTWRDFCQLESQWEGLLEMSASRNLMLTWDWISTWWEVFGQDRQLNVLLVRDGHELIGIAPLLKRKAAHFGILPYRRLEFLASGEDEADEICSEYLDFILRRGREREALGAILQELARDPDWDEIILADVPGQSPNLPILAELCPKFGAELEVICRQLGVYLDLPGCMESFLGRLSSKLRYKVRRDRLSAAKLGAALRVTDGPDGFEEAFDALIRLHQRRWTSRNRPGVFSSEKFTRFHRSIAPKLLGKGHVVLLWLVVSGEPVAALYCFVYAGKMHYYQGGFVECNGIQSPGMLIHSFAIERAIQMGLREYDFMKGDPNGYKSRWRGQLREILRLRLARPGFRESLRRAAEALRPTRRALKVRFGL
jgi:CelD/BcsL family acetyltransferase involved in cellulose biosynthesis